MDGDGITDGDGTHGTDLTGVEDGTIGMATDGVGIMDGMATDGAGTMVGMEITMPILMEEEIQITTTI